MIHVSAKHGVVAVPDREMFANIFPTAKRAVFGGENVVLLPHELDIVRFMRNLGETVPAPILTQYDWNSWSPFDVQRKTAALLTTNFRAYVLNGMGTGKTKAAIWSYDFLRKKGHAKKMLVVAPLSTLRFTWEREVFEAAPHLKTMVLHGTAARRRKRFADTSVDVYIINPDGLGIIEKEFLARDDISVLCLDEVAMFRNNSDRSKLARKLAAHTKWCWGMTGSPTPQSPTDAWMQCRIVTPETVPERFTHFRDIVQHKVTEFKWANKPTAADVVTQIMQPAVRFTLDDVVELPEVVERTIDIPMNPKQQRIYDELRKAAAAMVDNQQINAANSAVVLGKLLQVSMGYVYDSKRNVVDLCPDERLAIVSDIISSSDRKVIVFSPFTHALTGLATQLGKDKTEFARIDGGVSAAKRGDIFRLFQQTDKYKALIAHPNTMSHGLTLTAANTIIWFGPTTSLEVFEQANARIRRVGQRHRQQVIMLQSSAAEKRIYSMLRAKQKVQNHILELFALAS